LGGLGVENLVHLIDIWYFNCHFGIFYGHLVLFVTILMYFPHFGLLYQEKSGNPDWVVKSFLIHLHTYGSIPAFQLRLSGAQ
jgi:hypothetical protein